ncbi:MAG: MFS transporter [Lentimicrobiaceae bacterium]|nr:MFS transporter [Lentimicrobiaceae bacterium]
MLPRNITEIKKGDKKTIRAWVMYDWANSVYQLTIASAIFPVYYNQVTRNGGDSTVSFFGLEIINTVLYSWTIAAAYLLVAVFSPMFSSIADYTGRRKTFMKIFTWIGSVSCGLLFFFNGNNIEFGIICFALAWIGYGGSLVFYNSFLPVIAEPEDHDKISARGYSMGYLGGVVLLIINLIVVLFPGWFGITDGKLPAKLAFLSVCMWWFGFSQITFRRLPKYTLRTRENGHILFHGYQELRKVYRYVTKSYTLKIYLLGFFFLTMGILTVMFMAATYGEKELGLKEDILIPVILVIQLVGMVGAHFFSRLSSKIGNFKALIISIITWIFICIGVYFVTDTIGFVVAAFFVGLVMGGSQALARSTYSKMIPETTDHTSFFSFYDVMEKLATVAGTFSFGIIEALTGSMRNSVLAIILFFAVGLVFLLLLIRKQACRA